VHVHLARLGGSDRHELAFLQEAEQLDLRGGRHLADLVEEQLPRVGCGDGSRRFWGTLRTEL
jgi:hypothetical protein